MKTYAADPMDITVYATNGAHRYHSSRSCRALISGQDLNDWDCWDDYCNHHLHRTPRTIRETDLAGAVAAGKWPCHTCYPAGVQFPPILPSNDDFGHRPTKGISLFGLSEDVCQRCTERGVWYGGPDDLRDVHILWPCTSAIVLGLVPRPCPHCNGHRADPDEPGDWIPEVGMYNPYSSPPCPQCNGSGLAGTAPQ